MLVRSLFGEVEAMHTLAALETSKTFVSELQEVSRLESCGSRVMSGRSRHQRCVPLMSFDSSNPANKTCTLEAGPSRFVSQAFGLIISYFTSLLSRWVSVCGHGVRPSQSLRSVSMASKPMNPFYSHVIPPRTCNSCSATLATLASLSIEMA